MFHRGYKHSQQKVYKPRSQITRLQKINHYTYHCTFKYYFHYGLYFDEFTNGYNHNFVNIVQQVVEPRIYRKSQATQNKLYNTL